MQYKLLGRSGLRVSEICLGTMTFGAEWGYGADKSESQKMFDGFIESGGNFFDTANRYTEGTSEEYLGDFMKASGRRDEIVMASKYSLHSKLGRINDSGNHRKNLVQSLEGSLKRLKTDYIDLFYIHAWDFTTPEQEVMRALDDLVRSGKILHIGISDTPAWVIAKSNTIAELRGWTSFTALQIEYSLITREGERELIPMAGSFDMGVTSWAPLAGGALTGKYLTANDDPKRLKEGSKRLNDKSIAIAQTVVDIALEIGCEPAHVAVNWVKKKAPVMIPIVGARNAAQLNQNLDSLKFNLTAEQMQRLDEVSKFELGFPHDFLKQEGVVNSLFGGMRSKIDNHKL